MDLSTWFEASARWQLMASPFPEDQLARYRPTALPDQRLQSCAVTKWIGFEDANNWKMADFSPDRWLGKAIEGVIIEPVPLVVSIIRNGYLSGGAIVRRWSGRPHYRCGFHEHGQGLFLHDLQFVYPESFCLMDSGASLPYRYLQSASPADGSPPRASFDSPAVVLDQPLLYCGTCHNHFGHFLLEFLPRLWALELLDPGVRVQLTLVLPLDSLENWMAEIIDPVIEHYHLKGLILLGDGELIQAAEILMPSLAYASHKQASRITRELFQTLATIIRNSAAGQATGQGAAPAKLFLSRNPKRTRICSEHADVEQLFADAGYTVIYPEKLSVYEQIRMLSQAEEVGAFVGSATYQVLFADRVKLLRVVAPRDFLTRDDWLICSLMEAELQIAFGSTMSQRGPNNSGHWSLDPARVHTLLSP